MATINMTNVFNMEDEFDAKEELVEPCKWFEMVFPCEASITLKAKISSKKLNKGTQHKWVKYHKKHCGMCDCHDDLFTAVKISENCNKVIVTFKHA
jgi:hypothetical protein